MAPARSGLGLALGMMILPVLAVTCPGARAQTAGAIEGRVLTAVSGRPLEGARVCIRETGESAFADTGGNFSVTTRRTEGTLSISFQGYETSEVPYAEGALKRGSTTIRLNKDASAIPALGVGDSLPDLIWDLPLPVVNHPGGRTQLTLREYGEGRLLVLDFWATWCAPCVRSVEKWQQAVAEYGSEGLAVLPVYMGIFDKTREFMTARNWSLPAAVAENTYLLNSCFFDRYQVGGVVWIKDGRIAAISYENEENMEKIPLLLADRPVRLRSTEMNTHRNRK